jgi:hypothetical protein
MRRYAGIPRSGSSTIREAQSGVNGYGGTRSAFVCVRRRPDGGEVPRSVLRGCWWSVWRWSATTIAFRVLSPSLGTAAGKPRKAPRGVAEVGPALQRSWRWFVESRPTNSTFVISAVEASEVRAAFAGESCIATGQATLQGSPPRSLRVGRTWADAREALEGGGPKNGEKSRSWNPQDRDAGRRPRRRRLSRRFVGRLARFPRGRGARRRRPVRRLPR